jgi:hypothetical protein
MRSLLLSHHLGLRLHSHLLHRLRVHSGHLLGYALHGLLHHCWIDNWHRPSAASTKLA